MKFLSTVKHKLKVYYHVNIGSMPFYYKVYDTNTAKVKKNYKVIGLVRERNEALILKDTLDHLSQYVDGIVVYDDASTDNSVDIAKKPSKCD
jgi:hypothetical protein